MMKNFDYKLIYGFTSKNFKWIRIGWIKYGIVLKKTPLLFSERYGYTKYLKLPFCWRIEILKANGY